MNHGDDFIPPQRVPTLTEVIDWPTPVWPASTSPPEPAHWVEAEPAPMFHDAPEPVSLPPPEPLPVLTEDALVQRVLGDLQRQIDLMLDYRLREMLAPLLARATDSLIRDARNDLAVTLREIVARAVAQEMARRGDR